MAQGEQPLLLPDREEPAQNHDFDDGRRGDDRGKQRHPLELPTERGMDRYRIEVGYRHGVQPGSIVGAIANEAELDGRDIGRIEIYDFFSTVDLPERMPRETFERLTRARVCNQELRLSKVTGQRGGYPGADRPFGRRGGGRRRGRGGPRRRYAGAGAMSTIYLDNAATTPLRDEVIAAMAPFQRESWGNPSSVHRRGVAAREAIARARAQVARAVGAQTARVIFTSGGTEANNLALFGLLRGAGAKSGSIWIGPTEHASVRACAEELERDGFRVRRGALAENGALDLEDLERSLDAETLLVAQMLVSNEFGTIYPTARVAALARARSPRALVHVDAIQAVGKIRLSMTELGADSLSLSSHKIHGPQGVGALVLARDLPLRPLIFGGGQERAQRSGTENLAGIVGFGRAIELANEEQPRTLETLKVRRARLVSGLDRIAGVRCLQLGDDDAQQPGILSLLVPGAPAEVWLHHLDSRGVVVSVGSACQANKKELSPVLFAAGLSPDQARHVLRISLASTTSAEEIEQACKTFGDVAAELASL